MDFSVHINNKKKDVLVLGKGPTQGIRWYNTGCRKNVFN